MVVPMFDSSGSSSLKTTHMKRITPEVKKIADAHIEAKLSGSWNPAPIIDSYDLLEKVKSGYTYQGLLEEIEIRYVSITSLILASALNYRTDAYVKAIYKGFKTLLQK